MMDFLATNFNLPTIIGAVIVFGGTGLIVWHSHKHGGVGCDCGGSCHGEWLLRWLQWLLQRKCRRACKVQTDCRRKGKG